MVHLNIMAFYPATLKFIVQNSFYNNVCKNVRKKKPCNIKRCSRLRRIRKNYNSKTNLCTIHCLVKLQRLFFQLNRTMPNIRPRLKIVIIYSIIL